MKFISQNLKYLTTFKIGGIARYFCVCKSINELQDLVFWCGKQGMPWVVLGNGSNIIFADKGFNGLVIKLAGHFMNIEFKNETVEAGAGVFLPVLSRNFLFKGWGGFEFMCGIPGTIGGAVRMNAGTKQAEIKDFFVSSTILCANGKIKIVNKGSMNFSHRFSVISETRDIVLSSCFDLPYIDRQEHIKENMKNILKERYLNQPKIKQNCGSVFKRPQGRKPAGWYIDRSGLKGLRIGDAMVANEHANWIINMGNASAEHVKELIIRIQNEVFSKFHVTLEREVIFIPEDIMES